MGGGYLEGEAHEIVGRVRLHFLNLLEDPLDRRVLPVVLVLRRSRRHPLTFYGLVRRRTVDTAGNSTIKGANCRNSPSFGDENDRCRNLGTIRQNGGQRQKDFKDPTAIEKTAVHLNSRTAARSC